MKEYNLPLEEVSINQIYLEGNTSVIYQVPVYQRNYAWEDTEINALVKDVYDSYLKNPNTVYYIGTLVTYKRGDNLFEVIDGQQRLTTINLLLKALNIIPKNKLTYTAREISKNTIEKLPFSLPEEFDSGIKNGFDYAKKAINTFVESNNMDGFIKFFKNKVHIIHYRVPKDVDLNHYFEVMNSRGEQLEKHEIVKARLCEHLNPNDLTVFSYIWESCSEMNCFIQQKIPEKDLFGKTLSDYLDEDVFDVLCEKEKQSKTSIKDLLSQSCQKIDETEKDKHEKFQSIIDFPNFLLIVLKIIRMEEKSFDLNTFALDDKELLNEFEKLDNTSKFAKKFINYLLKAKYFLDNYIAHHAFDDKERISDNPWAVEYYFKKDEKHVYTLNLSEDDNTELVHLLSMFEVTFTPKARKNYLFYCLYYLFNNDYSDIDAYLNFLRDLADKYFYDIYLNKDNLNESNNLPKPNVFDNEIIYKKKMYLDIENENPSFETIYKNGSMNIPLFIFNYTDYKLWKKYADELRSNKTKKGDKKRKSFFSDLGCSDFELEPFTSFYFSRTRKSLEHYYPQAKAGEEKELSDLDINRFGNFAMISTDANSSGSNWDPKTKLDHYTDGKSDPVGVASLKFKIMMQICSDNDILMKTGKLDRDEGFEWTLEDMNVHQKKMMNILFSEKK